MNQEIEVAKYDVFEVSLKGKTEGNPFTDYTIEGVFTGDKEEVKAEGFYDGEGVYKVRFMPPTKAATGIV